MAAATKKKPVSDALDTLATLYAADLAHDALLQCGEPAKVSDVVKGADRSAFDIKLARVVLVTGQDRFTHSDRKWSIWSRYADARKPLQRNLEEMAASRRTPVSGSAFVDAMSAAYGRPRAVMAETVTRLLDRSDAFFPAGEDRYGLRAWLLDASSGSAEDILFDNELDEGAILECVGKGKLPKGADLESVVAFVNALSGAVPNLALQFLAWKASPATFDALRLYVGLALDRRVSALSDGSWIGETVRDRLEAQFAAIADREVEDASDLQPAAAAEPLVISDEDRARIVDRVLAGERTVRATALLEDVFEVTSADPTFEADLASVTAALRGDDRVTWVGADRFLPNGALPPYVTTVPETLKFPEVHFLDMEGNDVDLMLDDDGFDGTLLQDIGAMMAQDVGDEDLIVPPDGPPPATARCILKYHHKELGTYPLCCLPYEFFPSDAPVLQAELRLPSGQTTEIWVSNETRLVYGLLDWYDLLPVDSGAVFYLERQAPDRYALTYGEETEPAMFISRNRVNELLELGRRADSEALPTFEILREIMEHYRKGIEFITIGTELCIARRTRRRLIASLISGHHCFFQRGRAWVFDAKKLSQGFDKSKRKYLKK